MSVVCNGIIQDRWWRERKEGGFLSLSSSSTIVPAHPSLLTGRKEVKEIKEEEQQQQSATKRRRKPETCFPSHVNIHPIRFPAFLLLGEDFLGKAGNSLYSLTPYHTISIRRQVGRGLTGTTIDKQEGQRRHKHKKERDERREAAIGQV